MGDYVYISQVLPETVVDYLKEIKADSRLREIFKDERTTPNIVTDAIFLDQEGKLVLIERNHDPLGIALP